MEGNEVYFNKIRKISQKKNLNMACMIVATTQVLLVHIYQESSI